MGLNHCDRAQDTTVTWDVNGVVGGNPTVGLILNSQTTPNNTTYTAPQTLPAGGSVTVHARSNADPSFSASATITFTAAIYIALTPASATLAVSHRQTFTVEVNNTPNQNVAWLVNGIPGGNSVTGQICVTGSDPCQPVSASNGGSVDYVAPAGLPSPRSGHHHGYEPGERQSERFGQRHDSAARRCQRSTGKRHDGNRMEQKRFTAVILGWTNQQVIWSPGTLGCGEPGVCGSIDSTGLYTAPPAAPSPNLIDVIATSSEDITQSGTAFATINFSPGILSLSPTSAYAGSEGGFTLLVSGINFSPSNPGPGSTILVAGAARSTSCSSSTQCITSLAAADLQSAGNLSVQLQNPGGSLSNTQTFVVLAPGSGRGRSL